MTNGHCTGFRCMRPLSSPSFPKLCPECRKSRAEEAKRERDALARGEELRDPDDSAVEEQP